MILAASQAVSKDVGLLGTFLGIGVIVNVIIVFIAIQIRGERRQNEEQQQNLSADHDVIIEGSGRSGWLGSWVSSP